MTSTPFTRVGLQFAGYAYPGVPDVQLFERVADIARTAEQSGFDSLWTMDHVQQIATVGDKADPILEAYTTLAGLAVATSTAKLGVLVSASGFRNPALLAKMVTTIDVISRGRAVLGLGAGWHEEEYRAYGMEFPPIGRRMDRLSEAIQICRAMFTEHAPVFPGEHHRIDQALNVPPPVRPGGPPILVGGSGERRLIPMVARLADGCNFFGGPRTVRHKIDVLRRACEEAGRDPATITKTWLGTALIAESERDLRAGMERMGRLLGVAPAAVPTFCLCGTPEQVTEQAARYREYGVDGVIVSMDDAYQLEQVSRAGKALAEAMR